jgi:hypothetical protein
MASKRGPKEAVAEKVPSEESSSLYFPATQMDLAEFASEFRRRVQGSLWLRADKITVGDLVRLKEVEDESEKKAESKRPRELRVVWINKTEESTT